MSVTIVRVGRDPFDRGELTVFYRDSSINGGKDVFYLWACHWVRHYPTIPIPPEGFDAEPVREEECRSCVPYVLDPDHPERLSNTLVFYKKRI